jgi:hypothetical protein
MRSRWNKSVLIAGIGIFAGLLSASASETAKTDSKAMPTPETSSIKSNSTTPSSPSVASSAPSTTGSPSTSGSASSSGQKTQSSQTDNAVSTVKTTPSGKTYQSFSGRYSDDGASAVSHSYDRRSYYQASRRPVEYRHVERRTIHHHHVEYRRPRVVYVERHHSRPVYRHVAYVRPLRAPPVYYYDGQLIGRDPDPNVRLMIQRDNARTLWAR